MDLSKILSISGRPGLFKVISQGKQAVIVESLIDQKRFPAFGHEKISSLEEISIFTTGEDRPLKDVLKLLFEKLEGKQAPDPKADPDKITAFFLEMMPDYDKERVYLSDIRKIIAWYNLLTEHNLLDYSEPAKEEAETPAAGKEEAESPVVVKKEEKPEIKEPRPTRKKKEKE